MTFRYLDVCAGISALSVAAEPLGWQAAGYSEIEPFPRAVLQKRFGAVPVGWDHRHTPGMNYPPLFGDFTQIEAHHVGPIDLLCGGTPCQDFSIAGLRKGLAGERGNLTLEFARLADRLRPRWLGWENVPGVLSQDGGRAFGAFLGALAELGYGFAYRVLDAQFCRVDGYARAVPQRRRRVFVVGYLGDWRRAAAVLFDRESLSGNPAPRREAGEGVAGTLDAGIARRRGRGETPNALAAVEYVPPIVGQAMSSKWSKGSSGPAGDECHNLVAHALRGEGFDASEDGTGWNGNGAADSGALFALDRWAVRRLTPTECHRLQGFADDHCAITWRGKPAADGPQYKALGNSMAVNVMRAIMTRMAMVDALPVAQDDEAAS